MNRFDHKKLMQQKKRHKNYARITVLTSLGLGVVLANSTTVKAEDKEWAPNTSTTIKQGDKQYTIKWGDYLELISRDSGLTIGTLMKLNDSIIDANLIYEGNIIFFGDGVNAVVKDSKGNIIAKTPLTPADKEGIKKADAQKVNRATKINSKKNKDSKIIVNDNGDGTGTVTKPVKPIKPDPNKPKPPVKPDVKEVSMKIYYLQVASKDNLEEAVVLKEETVKAKKGEKITIKAKEFDNMNLISESSVTVTAENNAEIIFDYVHKDAREVTVRDITEDGKVLGEFTETDFDILVGEKISYTAGEYEGYEVVGTKEKTITVDTDNAKNIIEFTYRKKIVVPVEKVNISVEHIGTDGVVLNQESKSVEKGSTVTEKSLDFSDRGYELVGESNQTIKADKNTTITFKYKKIETKPVAETVNVWIKYVVNDGFLIEDENKMVEKGKPFKVEAKDFTEKGYILDDEATKEVTTEVGTTVTFKYKRIDPLEGMAVLTTKYVDEAGNEIHESKKEDVKIGYTYVTYPIDIVGYKEIDYKGRIGKMVAGGMTETIVYKKIGDVN
ncbi:MucBP domain-containing protein [Vagococcus hydrophili]|uniref:LysM domain-containing protein n=1 Tax=Vagococcus hydrophili TaxID=2714947 RepID=A0A6G8ARF5_9ENTE|nr:MucBP domain-containing protein [Vagococcus hydrophili]QIL47644.1 hypothetical protein G7082_03370 [Vagococcus hydrophili]